MNEALVALPAGIKIRTARRGDRDSIYRLLADVGIEVPSSEQSNTLSWIVSHPETEVFVAVDPLDKGVGMLALSHRPQLRAGGRIATVDEFVVAVALRRQGIGAELLDRALARARMLGCKRVEASVTSDASGEFFRKRGFADSSKSMSWENVEAK